MPNEEILCVGEVLWDALPAGLFLGGAPFNVACHLRAAGAPVALVSRVGADNLGEEARARVARYGVGTDLLQVDPELPTGFVRVAVDERGDAQFEIVAPSAWDAIEATPELLARAAAARAIVFGTLAQRAAVTRATVERLWDSPALMVFDVNLRPPHDDRDVVQRSLRRADVVKLNADELRRIAGWFRLAGDGERAVMEALAARFECRAVLLTRGARGAALLREGSWAEHPGFEVEVRDTVGAGDAFLAVALTGLLAGVDDGTLLRHANLAGAYVATQSGAVPADQPSAPVRPPALPERAPEPEAPAPRARRRR